MLECRACVLRCIRAIANDAPIPSRPLRPLLLTPRLAAQPTRRRLATTARAGPSDNASPVEDELGLREVESDIQAKHERREQRALRTELQYLKDPVKLAEHVHYTLRCDKPEKALDLCRLASKNMDCVVSWNHCVDWLMKRGRATEAIKIYNEMKKRAQYPDSYTYMVLLRGFPQHGTHHKMEMKKEMVGKALSIYNSMSSSTSRVRPNIMHTNAVLRLCSLAKDVDAMWTVVSNLPESGLGSADHITYTVLLGAIRHNAVGSEGQDPAEQSTQSRQQAVNEGRRIWMEIIKRWRGGEVIIDEALVCEMGNLLLISRRMEDWDDVLSLVQQTMNIERKLPAIGSPERHTGHVRMEEYDDEPSATATEDSEGWVPTSASNAFNPVQPLAKDTKSSKRPSSLVWVQPGNAALSVLLVACAEMRSNGTATTYWDGFVKDYGVTPDLRNFHALLKLLAMNRSDTKAATLLREMAGTSIGLRNMTFRMALTACARNWKNPNVMANANSMMDTMEKTLPYPDTQTMARYLSLALKTDDGPKIVAALDRMDPMIHVLRSKLTFGADQAHMDPDEHLDDREDTVTLFKMMIGVIDTLMHRSLVPREEFRDWHARRSQLNAFLTRTNASMDLLRLRLQRGRGFPGDKAKTGYAPTPESAGRDATPVRRMRQFGEDANAFRHKDRDAAPLRRASDADSGFGRKPAFGGATFDGTRSKEEDQRLQRVKAWMAPQRKERLAGVSKWRVEDAGGENEREDRKRPKREWLPSDADTGFADSPADFGMR